MGTRFFSPGFRQKTYLSSTPADNIFVYIPNEWLHEKDMRDDSKVFLAGYFCPFCPVAGCIDHAVDRIPDNGDRQMPKHEFHQSTQTGELRRP